MRLPLTRGGANAIEYRPQVEIGDYDCEPAAIRGNQRRGDPHARNTRRAGRPARLFELDRGDVNVSGRKRYRLLEIVLIAVVLQLCVGCGAACPACSRAVHADDFAAAILSV